MEKRSRKDMQKLSPVLLIQDSFPGLSNLPFGILFHVEVHVVLFSVQSNVEVNHP